MPKSVIKGVQDCRSSHTKMPYIAASRLLKEKLGYFWYLQRNNIEKTLRSESLMFIVDGKEICSLDCREVVGRATDTFGGQHKGRSMTVKEKYALIGHPLIGNPWCIEAYGIEEFFPLEYIYIFRMRQEAQFT